MRLLLAGAMLKNADILLLDEPTNHLDVHAIEWLCNWAAIINIFCFMHDGPIF